MIYKLLSTNWCYRKRWLLPISRIHSFAQHPSGKLSAREVRGEWDRDGGQPRTRSAGMGVRCCPANQHRVLRSLGRGCDPVPEEEVVKGSIPEEMSCKLSWRSVHWLEVGGWRRVW